MVFVKFWVCVLISWNGLISQVLAAPDTLVFNGLRVTQQGIEFPNGRQSVLSLDTHTETEYYLLALNGDIQHDTRDHLQHYGFTPYGWVAGGGYFVYYQGDEFGLRAVAEQPLIRWVVPLTVDLKLAHECLLADEERELLVVVRGFPRLDRKAFHQHLAALGVAVTETFESGWGVRFGLVLPASAYRQSVLVEVAGFEGVQLVRPGAGAKLMSVNTVPLLQSGVATGTCSIWERGIYGQGQIVAVCDTGIDADSCFFRDPSGTLPPVNDRAGTVVEATRRVVIAANFLYQNDDPLNAGHWDRHGHGTSVSGCIGGSDIADPTGTTVYNGVAPLAQNVTQNAGIRYDDCADLPGLGCPVVGFKLVLEQAYAQGARFQNNSWGDRENFFPHNTYTETCFDVDEFVWERDDFLVVCAAGNDGRPETVNSPGVAKNALSVGGTQGHPHQHLLMGFSSRGPAHDGRTKPELIAPASARMPLNDRDVFSNNCDLHNWTGTSFSSPYACGAAALVRQYFTDGYYPTGQPTIGHRMSSPSAALVKGMLIHSCVAINSTAIPSVDQGWGRIQLDNALRFEDSDFNLWVLDRGGPFSTGSTEILEYRFWVQSQSRRWHTTLIWSDYPATPGSAQDLVNDLDLEVTFDGRQYWGNAFEDGWSVVDGEPDRIDNVEQVILPAPMVGEVIIRVHAQQIPEGPQPFTLIVSGQWVESAPSPALWRIY